MKANKLFGICIGVLIALTLVNAITLDQLLDSYNNNYDDGGFTADFTAFKSIWASPVVPGKEAGRNDFNFTIGGSNATGLYTAVATLNIENTYSKDNVIVTKNLTNPGLVSFSFDGNLYGCNQYWDWFWPPTQVIFDVELKIYKNNVLRYQKLFKQTASCLTRPVYFDYTQSKALKAVDTGDADTLYDYLNASLYFYFPENKAYKLGLYLWDNKSATVYTEKTITTGATYQNFIVPFIINATSLKDFELKNSKLLVKSITVDGHVVAENGWINYDQYNLLSSTTYNTADFERDDVLITNVSFDKTMSGNKLSQLGAKINTANSAGVYNIELSLENKFGENIKTVNKTTVFSGNTETLWFNGTEIYNSKVSGPYRVGFLRITKSGNDFAYRLDAATSGDLQYTNFTSPALPDLMMNLTGNSSDINVTVYNLGEGDAAGVTLSLYDQNSNKIKEIIISEINSTQSYFYSFKSVNLTHAFVFADFSNLIEETNESNNLAEFMLQGALIQPAVIISKQPLQNSITINQTKQFNVTVNGTLPIDYKWYINNGSIFNLVSTSNNFVFTPNYYDEGLRTLKINVSNANGSDQESWNVNVTLNKIAVYAYVYNKNELLLGNKVPINADISFDGVVKSAATTTPAKINLTVDSVHNLNYTSAGFKNFTTKFFFDRALFTCKENQNCVLTNTNCAWDTTNNDNWACTVTNGAVTDYFRMYTNPKRVKINAYLAVNS